MNKFALTILFCFFIYNLFAQKIDYIENYHKFICNAEQQTIKSNFDSALYYYNIAFNKVPYAFEFDYRNAAYIAYKAGNINKAQQYVDSVIVRDGMIDERFKMYFPDTCIWSHLKNQKLNQLLKIYNNKIDKAACLKIDSLIAVDQGLRQFKWNSKAKLDSVIKIDSIVAEKLINLYTEGLLNEWKLSPEQRGSVGTILCHKMIDDFSRLRTLYKFGIIDKLEYYYPSVRNALQWNLKTTYLLPDKKANLNSPKINKVRVDDGIIPYERMRDLKKFAKKSKGMYRCPYVL